MSVTAEAKSKRPVLKGRRPEAALPPAGEGETIAPPPKLRRRPLLVAASVAAICLGALLAVLGLHLNHHRS